MANQSRNPLILNLLTNDGSNAIVVKDSSDTIVFTIYDDGTSLASGLINYESDLSGSYTARSLTDMTYVDTQISTNAATASNGLTKTVNDIALGGELTTSTYIDVASNQLNIRSISSSFNIGTGVTLRMNDIAVQTDGKIVIVGDFTDYNGTSCNRIARVNTDGSIDTSFVTNIGTGANGDINTVAIQADGKIVIGGSFSTFNGTSSSRFSRLNADGTLDTTFVTAIGTGFNNTVESIYIQSDTSILIGGNFTTFNGVSPVTRIVRLDSAGARDTSFSSNVGTKFNNDVFSVFEQSGGEILVGGEFTSFDSGPTGIARLNANGTSDSTFNTNLANGVELGGWVNAVIAQTDGKVLIGGDWFGYSGDYSYSYICRINANGTLDSTFNTNQGSGANQAVFDLEIQSDGKIIGVGNFTWWGGSTGNRVGRLNSDGTLDTTFRSTISAAANNTIYASALDTITNPDNFFIGGLFTSFNSQSWARFIGLNSDGTFLEINSLVDFSGYGARYGNDYSNYFTPTSLVDKAYVDSQIINNTVTVSNDIKLSQVLDNRRFNDPTSEIITVADGTLPTVETYLPNWSKFNSTEFGTAHSTLYINGYVYLSSRQMPARIAKVNANDFTDIEIFTFPGTNSTSLFSVADRMVYSDYNHKIYIPFGDPDFNRGLKIVEVDPDDITSYTDVINTAGLPGFPTGVAHNNKLYILTGATGKLYEYDLDTYNLDRTLTFPASGTFHAINIDGDFIYVSGIYAGSKVYKVSLDTFLTVDSIALPTEHMTDEFAIVGDYLWLGHESNFDAPNKGLYVVNKNDLSDYKHIFVEETGSCYGIFYDNNYIWAIFVSDPGVILRINPATFEVRRMTFDASLINPNSIAFDGSNFYVSNFEVPTTLAKFTVPTLADEVYFAGSNNDVLVKISDITKEVTIGDTLNLTDTTVSVSRNIYDDLVFEDPNAGILTLSDLSLSILERELMFYGDQEVTIQHIESESISSANLSSSIVDIEYSINDGAVWADPAYPIVMTAGMESLWRVKTYAATKNSGNIILNSSVLY